MTMAVKFSLDTSKLDAAMPDLQLFFERLQKVVPGVIDLSHVVPKLFVFECDDLAASVAGHCRFALEPTECFLMLVAASRAGELDLGVVKNLLGHDFFSDGCLSNSIEDRSPVESQDLTGGQPHTGGLR